MKNGKFFAVCCGAFLGLSLFLGTGAVNASAEEVPCFTTDQSGVNVSTSAKGITTATGTAAELMTLEYTASVDFSEGASFKYVIPQATDTAWNSSPTRYIPKRPRRTSTRCRWT